MLCGHRLETYMDARCTHRRGRERAIETVGEGMGQQLQLKLLFTIKIKLDIELKMKSYGTALKQNVHKSNH